MSDHPATPWCIHIGMMANEGRTFIKSVENGGYKRWVAETTRAFTPNGKRCDQETARRIVACVNACAGIPTEALEQGAIAEVIREAAAWQRILERQRASANPAQHPGQTQSLNPTP